MPGPFRASAAEGWPARTPPAPGCGFPTCSRSGCFVGCYRRAEWPTARRSPWQGFRHEKRHRKKKEKEKRKEEWGVDRDSDSDTKLGARSIPRSLRKRGRRARQTINPEISRLAPVVGVRRAHRSPLYRWAFDQNKEIRGLDPDSNRALNKLLEFLPVLFRHPGKLHSDPKARSAGDDFAIRP